MFVATLSATAAEVFTYIGYILLALVGLMIMIVVHEFGHYIAGKLLHFKIEEFAIGFGPALFKRRNKKTGELFSIRAFPIGGFCGFYEEDSDTEDKEGFNSHKPWQRLIVLFSGALFNFLSAILIIAIYFTAYGQLLPVITKTYNVNGEANVFQAGDVILAVDGKQVNIMTQDDYEAVFADADNGVTVKVLRDGKAVKITVEKGSYTLPAEDNDGVEETKTGMGIRYGFLR